MPPKKTPADYHTIAKKRGFRWLGPEVPNTHTSTGWQCESGHQWEARYDSIRRGAGCPFCSGKAPRTPADYHALAEERGFRWLGPEVRRVILKTTWQCAQDHRWETSYNNIQQGSGCPFCAGQAPKTPTDYHSLAERRDFQWLGPKVPNTATKTLWQCGEGHQWEATYKYIRKGRGCPHCAGLVPKNPEDYQRLAEERGFCWLGPEVPNIQTNTGWQCEEGHQWEARYSSIQRGSGCPFCAGVVPRTPADYHALARKRGFTWLGLEVSNARTKTAWQCEDGHEWEACYDKIRQGRGCPYCSGRAPKTPSDYHALAAEREFRWLGPEVPATHDKTTWECQKGHQWEAAFSKIQHGTGCPFCSGKAPKTPADYHALAEERGFRWLGPEAPRIDIKTGWQCEHGHIWETPYANIQGGTGCPFCAGTVPKTPADYIELARERGFRWLGTEVPTVLTKTGWKCAEGHEWEATYANIQQGKGCPFCAGIAPKTPEDYRALAAQRGFQWLGPEVPNVGTRTTWQCEQGHKWEARHNSIQQGQGCPSCVDIVHGAQVSQIQRDLCTMLDGELNHPFGRYCIDVALTVGDTSVAVEYDAWYWHGHQQQYDSQRDEEMIAAGWQVLRIRSNRHLPSKEQVDAALELLLSGEKQVEIVLDDWGVGPTRFEPD